MKEEIHNFFLNSNQLVYNESYWKYLKPDFEIYITEYLQKFEMFRNNSISKTEWERLPFKDKAKDESWAFRRSSLKIIQKEIKTTRYESVLEIGAWNGWLSKFIAPECSRLVAVDYFVHPFDGIGAIEKFHPNICAVQTDLDTIFTDFKRNSFDLIVLNHNLAFVHNPTDYLLNLIPLLKKNGKILALGNMVFKNPKKIIQLNELLRLGFKNKFDAELYIHPLKGYLDYSDLNILKSRGFRVKKYRSKFLPNLYAMINQQSPTYIYIEFQNS